MPSLSLLLFPFPLVPNVELHFVRRVDGAPPFSLSSDRSGVFFFSRVRRRRKVEGRHASFFLKKGFMKAFFSFYSGIDKGRCIPLPPPSELGGTPPLSHEGKYWGRRGPIFLTEVKTDLLPLPSTRERSRLSLPSPPVEEVEKEVPFLLFFPWRERKAVHLS